MQGSYLIIGKSENLRNKYFSKLISRNLGKEYNPEKNEPDLLLIETVGESKSIGIDQVKKIPAFFATKPFNSEGKTVLIKNAHLMTVPSQNAMLKSLEEPPKFGLFILEASDTRSLLETITSRCKLINVDSLDKHQAKTVTKISENITEANKKVIASTSTSSRNNDVVSVYEIMEYSNSQRLEYAVSLSSEEKEDILNTIDTWLKELRDGIITSIHARAAQKLINLKKDLEDTNVSTKLAVENTLLNLLDID